MKEIKEFIQELCDCAKPSANGSVGARCRKWVGCSNHPI